MVPSEARRARPNPEVRTPAGAFDSHPEKIKCRIPQPRAIQVPSAS
jgi:hypothetical protein